MSKFNILEQTVPPPEGQAFKEVLFTFKNGDLYAITPRWPGGKLTLKDVSPGSDTEVTFLESAEVLPWRADGDDFVITPPKFDPNRIKSRYAYVFKLTNIRPDGR
ncbi:MAG: hypothetical protein ISS70_23265 [Phycisphaerae bacterium]|nr:hypothetical protein [Phycisphaerae bacterium]